MNQYLSLLENILLNGNARGDRTGTGTMSLFGEQLRFDLGSGFPLLTTKKVWFEGVVKELLWIISGSTNVRDLQAQGVHIWDEWAAPDGELGPVYGAQWRSWGGRNDLSVAERKEWVISGHLIPRGLDQLSALVQGLKKDPFGRRHIVTAWNPSDLPSQKLPPCHCFFQCYVTEGDVIYQKSSPLFGGPPGRPVACGTEPRKLSLHMYQRSADVFLGVPFNIASYALLTHMLAHVCGYDVGSLVISFGDVHIYNNHVDQVLLQLTRDPLPLPKLVLNKDVDDITAFSYNDICLEGYTSHPGIKAPVSV